MLRSDTSEGFGVWGVERLAESSAQSRIVIGYNIIWKILQGRCGAGIFLHKLFSEKKGDCASGAFGCVDAAVWCVGAFWKNKKPSGLHLEGFCCIP